MTADGAATGCAAAGRCRAAADHTGARTGSEVPTSVREKEGLDCDPPGCRDREGQTNWGLNGLIITIS